MKSTPRLPAILAVLAGAILSTVRPAAAQNVWIGVNNVSATTNWSDTANWSLAMSPAGSDALFGNDGAASAAGTINSVVDTLGLDTSSLTFTNGSHLGFYHTILIPAGITLANANALIVGVSSPDNGYLTTVNVVGGGTLVQNGANMTVKDIGSSLSSGALATLDLSGLNNFVYQSAGGTITVASAPSGGEARGGGILTLAAVSNYISGGTIALALGTGNGGTTANAINLGAGTNVINVGTVNVAAGKLNTGAIKFLGSTGGLRLRGEGGTDADRANFTLGRRGNTGSGTINGNLFLNGHPVDIMAGTMTLGLSTANQSGQTVNGVLQFNTGVVDANTINLAVCSGNAGAIANGTVTVGGGLLQVGNFSLVNQTLGVATGNLNISGGGTVTVSGDLVKTTTAGVGNITINVGTLNASNALGAVGAPIDNLNISDATLTLAAGASANANVTTLTCGGTTNKINITSIPVVSSYPAQVPVIKYAGALGGTFNIGVGTLPPSSPAYAGYITNNATDGSINLVVTGGPMPARTISWNGTVAGGDWDTTTANWLFSGLPTTYNEADFVRLDDTATGTTAVNLTGMRVPSSVTVSNVTKVFGFTGPGFISGLTGITKDGAATLYITNSGVNDYAGNLVIIAGTVQVGDGNFAGNLGPGDIVDDGVLAFSRADQVILDSVITGTGSVRQNGSGSLTLYGANAYDGSTLISQGTLQTGNATALGSTNGGTTVSSGATLDFLGRNVGLEPVTVSGSGVGSAGALVNNGTNDIFPAVAYVTLAGNTVFGGSMRWDLRSASTGNPTQSSLLTGGQPYKLTKVGPNQIGIVGSTVDPALGDVEVQAGILGLEGAITGLGNTANNLTVWPGAQVKFFNVTNQLNKRIYLGSDGGTASLRNDSGDNTVIGPITMTNDCSITVDGGTTLRLNGPLSGGLLTKMDSGNLVLGGAATHAGTVINSGQLTLNGTHTGGITNTFFGIFAGSGTNAGFADVSGWIFPGDTNVPGTITLGGLVLQFGANVSIDLTSSTTVGGGVNDLIQVNGDLTINGNSVFINPRGLLQVGVPYRLANYTGNLIWNADLFVSGPNNYVFTVDTNTAGQINLVATGGPPIWNGASATGNLWSDPANWGGVAIQFGDTLYFGGSTRLNNMNDTPADTVYSLGFNTGAGAFVLNGNPVSIGGNIINGSANTQTINLGLDSGVNNAFNGGSGMLIIARGFTNTANLTTLTLGGNGVLTNLLGTLTGFETNTLAVTSNGNWTLADNPSSTAITNPTALDIQGGTFNFGSGSSAPVLASTTTINTRIGVLPGVPATFNMVNGLLDIAVRFNMGAAGDTISTLNQVGGTIIVMDVLQCADSSATAVSTVNASGGLLNVGESEGSPNSFFLCSRGTGTLNVSGTALVRCGTLDVSRNASSAGSTGVVNLNGGTLDVQRVSTGTSSAGTAGTPTATFNFNGGTLRARQSRSDFFIGRLSTPAIPITSIVKAGGAIVDSAGFNVGIGEPLQHDAALGVTPDGGLIKNGAGTLTLTAVNTYTGPTVVNDGALAVAGSLANGGVIVESGGELTGTGTIGGAVTNLAGSTINPGAVNAIGTLTVAGNVGVGGTLLLELNRTNAQTSDRLTVGGAATYTGTLSVTNIGPALQAGDTFHLFGAAVSGFATIDLATTDASGNTYTWTDNIGSDGTISVATVAPPVDTTPTNITVSVAGNQLVLSWPPNHTGWHLQAQTNSSSVGLTTNWVTIPNSDQFNSYTNTVDRLQGAVFYRLVYP